jgi:steroid delta-isomerase-like uncharacterized protein
MRKPSLWTFLLLISLSTTAQAANEQEKNKAIARSLFEQVLDQGHLEQKYAESHAADFVAHGRDHDATLAEDMEAAREERKALPDMRVRVNQMVAEGDLVVVYWAASGTNTHEGMGFPATGKKIVVPGMTIFRFKKEKISEEWSVFDMSSALQQMGLCPPTPQP